MDTSGGFTWMRLTSALTSAEEVQRNYGTLLAAQPPRPRSFTVRFETGGDRISDLHVWQLGPGHFGAIVAIRSAAPQPLAVYRARLSHLKALSHLTVEIEPEG